MAFLPENEQNQNAPQGQTSNNPQQVPPQGTGGSVGAGSAGPKAGTTTGTPTQFGSSSSKLGDYLTANAPQIQNQANSIAGNLNTQYGAANQEITNAANQFGQQVQGGYTSSDPNVVNQALSNPQQFTQNADNVSKFQKQLNNQYTGPQNFQGTDAYSQVQGDVTNAVNTAQPLNTQAGLQNYFATQNGNQSRGTNTLDALLTMGNQGARDTVKTAVDQFNNLNPALQNAATNASNQVSAAQQAANDSRNYAQNAFNTSTSGLNKTLADQLTQKQKDVADYNTYEENLIKNNNFAGGNNLGLLGMTWDQYTALENALNAAENGSNVTAHNVGMNTQTTPVDLLSYYNAVNPTAYNLQNTASADQYAQAKALEQLGGGTYQSGLVDPTQAGTAPDYQHAFDFQGVTNDAGAFAQQAQAAAQNAVNQQAAQLDAQHNAHQGLGGFLKNNLAGIINPLASVPKQISLAKNLSNKI